MKHGVDCKKVYHALRGDGYLHMEGDDSPYFDDGVKYCGRCHEYLTGERMKDAARERAMSDYLAIAQECGALDQRIAPGVLTYLLIDEHQLAAYTERMKAEERERCAKICCALNQSTLGFERGPDCARAILGDFAEVVAAIRHQQDDALKTPSDDQWFGDMMILQVLADSDSVNDQEREVLTRWMAASERPGILSRLRDDTLASRFTDVAEYRNAILLGKD